MHKHLHLDFETFSEADIREVGAYRYANDPSTEILIAAMALGDEEPFAWYQMPGKANDWEALEDLFDALQDPEVLIYAHNAMFEMAICQALLEKTFGIKSPDLSRFRCTMSLARRACLPAKLETLAETLGIANQKDKRGTALIKKFSVMQPAPRVSKKNPNGGVPFRIRPQDDPAAFAEFVEYCKQDVRAEQEISRKLAYFDDPTNNANYSLDARINARGVPVNLKALRHAQKLIEEETEIVSGKFRELVGFEVTQNARLLEWVNANGYKFENLQAETVDSFLDKQEQEGRTDIVIQALSLKQSIAYASIKKVRTMLDCAGPHDNRIRGMLNYHGASTGRWTGALVQPQNFKKATIEDSDGAYGEIQDEVPREMLELCRGPVLEVISSCIRHFFHPEEGFLDADYAAIEGRVMNWLAGQEDVLKEYRDGLDRYKVMAAFIFNVPYEKVDKAQRFVGKCAILALGYQMSASKFQDTCLKLGKVKISDELAEKTVTAFRIKHAKLKQYWFDVEDCAKKAILAPGKIITLRNVQFLVKNVEGTPFLLIKLPSGRKLAYPRPKLAPSRKFPEKDAIHFFGNIQGNTWGTIDTYGAKLVENITQAVSMDLMANGTHNVENAGYEVATLIHDQCLAYYDQSKGQTAEEFVALLTKLPPWADGLPLAAEGGLVPYYRKD